MNIGIFTDCYFPTKNGVVTSIVQLKEGLERRGHRATILTVKTPQYNDHDPTVYRFPSIPFNTDIDIRIGLVNQRVVNRIVQHEQLDILHTHTEFSLGWAAKRAARSMKLPLIHTAHTMYADYRHYLLFGNLIPATMIQRLLKRFLVGYNVLVCPSRKAQQYFSSFMPNMRTVVIGNGVCKIRFNPNRLTNEEQEHTRKALGIQSSDKVMLYVGRMAKEKRVLELLNVLTPLLQKNSHYKALFVGCGPSYQQMINTAKHNNVRQQVIFTGYVNWEHIHTLYSIADVFVTASLSEVHPMTVIEAMMCGLPIVARRDESCTELIEDEYNGYLVDSDLKIPERVLEILCDEAKWLTFSRNGLNLSGKFTTETHVEKCESLYQHVIKNP